ncbi:hypothetical protein [Fictibacillus sp. NRS-1165]|uniref:hypothetical protein n=1 Tax=Fictibacillus sp. NRS-1165 TaxID=3144463 RepID=UPI003D1FD7ED
MKSLFTFLLESEEGVVYKDLPIAPVHADPLLWKEETISMLNEELRRTDNMMVKLLDELEDLKRQVDQYKSAEGVEQP